jgi:predicted signal transduction protein with EAL and GGDEF domain
VLQNVAGGLKHCCRSSDLVARLGGDEFVMVVSNPAGVLPDLMGRIAGAGHAAGAELKASSKRRMSECMRRSVAASQHPLPVMSLSFRKDGSIEGILR